MQYFSTISFSVVFSSVSSHLTVKVDLCSSVWSSPFESKLSVSSTLFFTTVKEASSCLNCVVDKGTSVEFSPK